MTNMEEALRYVKDCFEAAQAEGLSQRIAEADGSTGTLCDLVMRRLVPAYDKVREVLDAQKS